MLTWTEIEPGKWSANLKCHRFVAIVEACIATDVARDFHARLAALLGGTP